VRAAPHLASVIRYLRARANGKGELIFGIATSCVINAVQLTNAVCEQIFIAKRGDTSWSADALGAAQVTKCRE